MHALERRAYPLTQAFQPARTSNAQNTQLLNLRSPINQKRNFFDSCMCS